MREIRVYEVGYEMIVTDKEIKGAELAATFDSVAKAERYVESEEMWLQLDKDLIGESQYSWVGDDYEEHIVDCNSLEVWYGTDTTN